jgi:hypothetical protein
MKDNMEYLPSPRIPTAQGTNQNVPFLSGKERQYE